MVTEFAVVGAGLAGVAVALELSAIGETVLLGPESPSAPIAIAHPFAGRSVDVSAERMDAYRSALDWWQKHDAQGSFHRRSDVRRAAPKDSRLARSYKRAQASMPPWLEHDLYDDVLTYGSGITARLDAFVAHQRERLNWKNGRLERWQTRDSNVLLGLDDGTTLRAKTLVLCVGAGIQQWQPNIDSQVTVGELALCQGNAQDCIQIGVGCHASASVDGLYALGSTYAAHDEDIESMRKPFLDRAQAIVDDPQVQTWYRGARYVLLPEREPKIWALQDSVFVVAGLGSKGVAWSAWLAKQLVRNHLPRRQA